MTFWMYAALPVWLFAIAATGNWFIDWCFAANRWWSGPLAFAFGVPWVALGVTGVAFILFAPVIL